MVLFEDMETATTLQAARTTQKISVANFPGTRNEAKGKTIAQLQPQRKESYKYYAEGCSEWLSLLPLIGCAFDFYWM